MPYEVILEAGEGGRWYERGVDGSECDWGRVLLWQPPHRLVFTWQISGAWQFDPDRDHASEIEVRFTADGPEQTTVAVEHRHFERLDGGQAVNDAIRGGGGWTLLLEPRGRRAPQNQPEARLDFAAVPEQRRVVHQRAAVHFTRAV